MLLKILATALLCSTGLCFANGSAIASYLQRSPERCLLRLVWQRHQTKDATEL